MGQLLKQHQFIAPSPIKGAWRNNFSEPGTIILKALFLCNNSKRNSLLIHGFWPDKAVNSVLHCFLCENAVFKDHAIAAAVILSAWSNPFTVFSNFTHISNVPVLKC